MLFGKSEGVDKGCRMRSIEAERIRPNPHQPRERMDGEELAALADSIARHGLLQPITVRRIGSVGEKAPLRSGANEVRLISEGVFPSRPSPVYEIVAGERRYRAARMAGMKQIPCLILSCDERESAELALVENLQRQDLDPFEEAAAIASLLDLHPMTQEQMAKRLSVSQSYVANKLRLLKLSEEERELIRAHSLTERHARAVLKLDKPSDRMAILRAVAAGGLSVARTEQMVAMRLVPSAPPPPRPRARGTKDLRLFTNTIEHAVASVCRAGGTVSQERKEDEGGVEYWIRIERKRG